MIIKRAALNSLLAFTLAFNVFTPNKFLNEIGKDGKIVSLHYLADTHR